jgi:hypothetical protein
MSQKEVRFAEKESVLIGHSAPSKITLPNHTDLLSSLDKQSKIDYGFYLLRNNYRVYEILKTLFENIRLFTKKNNCIKRE